MVAPRYKGYSRRKNPLKDDRGIGVRPVPIDAEGYDNRPKPECYADWTTWHAAMSTWFDREVLRGRFIWSLWEPSDDVG